MPLNRPGGRSHPPEFPTRSSLHPNSNGPARRIERMANWFFVVLFSGLLFYLLRHWVAEGATLTPGPWPTLFLIVLGSLFSCVRELVAEESQWRSPLRVLWWTSTLGGILLLVLWHSA